MHAFLFLLLGDNTELADVPLEEIAACLQKLKTLHVKNVPMVDFSKLDQGRYKFQIVH